MKKILVAIDGSAASAEAVTFGVELAGEHESELTFVHVVHALDVFPIAGRNSFGGLLPHAPAESDNAMLEEAVAAAAEHAIVSTTALLQGDTVDEIVAYADSHRFDMIVLGSRGLGAKASALLGSVSRGVLGESKTPVMIVRSSPAAVPAGS